MRGNQKNSQRSGSKGSEQKYPPAGSSPNFELIPGFDLAEVIVVQANTIETLLNKLKEAEDRIHELEESNLELVRKLSDNIISKSKRSIDRVSSHPNPPYTSKSIGSETKIRKPRENRLQSYDQPRQGSSERLLSKSDSFQKNFNIQLEKTSQIPNNPSLSNLNWQTAMDNPSMIAPQSARQTTRYHLSIAEQNIIPDELDVMMYQDTDFRQTPRTQSYYPQQLQSYQESRIKSPNIPMPKVATNLEIPEVSPTRSPQKQTISIKEALSMSQPVLNQFESDLWTSQAGSPSGYQRPASTKQKAENSKNNHQHLSSGRYVLEKIREDLTQEVSNPTSGRRRSTQVEIETKQSLHALPLRAEQEYRPNKSSVGPTKKMPMRPTNSSKQSAGGSRQPVVAKHPRNSRSREKHEQKEENWYFEPRQTSRTQESMAISTGGTYDFKVALSNYENLSMMLSRKKEAAKNYSLAVISEIAGVGAKPRKKKSSSARENREPEQKIRVDFGIQKQQHTNESVSREIEPSLFVGATDNYTYTPSNHRKKAYSSEQSRGANSDAALLSHRANIPEGSYGFPAAEERSRSKFELDAQQIKLSEAGEVRSKNKLWQADNSLRASPRTLGNFSRDWSYAAANPGKQRPAARGSHREVYSTCL